MDKLELKFTLKTKKDAEVKLQLHLLLSEIFFLPASSPPLFSLVLVAFPCKEKQRKEILSQSYLHIQSNNICVDHLIYITRILL